MEWLLHTAARSFIFETILMFDDLFLLSAKNRVYELYVRLPVIVKQ